MYETSIWWSNNDEILHWTKNDFLHQRTDRTIITTFLNGLWTAWLDSTFRLYVVCLVTRLSLYNAILAYMHKQLELLIRRQQHFFIHQIMIPQETPVCFHCIAERACITDPLLKTGCRYHISYGQSCDIAAYCRWPVSMSAVRFPSKF